MKLRALLFVALAACGGSSNAAETTPPPAPEPAQQAASPCDEAATAIVAALHADQEIPPDKEGVVEAILVERCAADAWSQAAIDCFRTATGEAIEACAEQNLTEDQMNAVERRVEAEAEPDPSRMKKEDAKSAAPPPAPPPPAESADPCDGGE